MLRTHSPLLNKTTTRDAFIPFFDQVLCDHILPKVGHDRSIGPESLVKALFFTWAKNKALIKANEERKTKNSKSQIILLK